MHVYIEDTLIEIKIIFFRVSTFQRRSQNHILKLQGPDGVWLESEGTISNHIISFDRTLFSSGG